jgi:hypothetical protein
MSQRHPQLSNRLSQWDVASLIDLDYLNEENADLDTDIKKRDRSFYLKLAASCSSNPIDLASRSAVLRLWVEEQRESPEFPKPGPGETIVEVLDAFRFWGFLVCVLLGATFAWGALNISGGQVNVILFWFLTVGLPFSFTIFGFYLLLGEKFSQLPGPPGILRIWLGRWLVNTRSRTTRLLQRKTPQEHAIRIERFLGNIKRRTSGREHFFMSALGSLLHLLGVGLVTGIFLAIVLFRSFSYQDYGWQTHAGWLTEKRIHSIVLMVSSPWAWLSGEGEGYPTKSQISETRIFQNNSSVGENLPASETWSLFLLWSSLFYSVLPRLGLYSLGRAHLRRALDRENFLRFDTLWRRLTIPEVTVQAPGKEISLDKPLPHPIYEPAEAVQGPTLLLIPVDLDTSQLRARLQPQLRRLNLEFSSVDQLPSLPSERQSLLQSFTVSKTNCPSRLLVLQEAFMPPNQSFVRFLKNLRETFGIHVPIHVVLLRDSEAQDSTQHLEAWRSRLDVIGDPLLSLVAIFLEPEMPLSTP